MANYVCQDPCSSDDDFESAAAHTAEAALMNRTWLLWPRLLYGAEHGDEAACHMASNLFEQAFKAAEAEVEKEERGRGWEAQPRLARYSCFCGQSCEPRL